MINLEEIKARAIEIPNMIYGLTESAEVLHKADNDGYSRNCTEVVDRLRDIPALIAEVERQQKELDWYRARDNFVPTDSSGRVYDNTQPSVVRPDDC